MKSCDEVIKIVLERSHEIKRARARRKERIKILSASAAISLALIATIGIGVWRSIREGAAEITSAAESYRDITVKTSEAFTENGSNIPKPSGRDETSLCLAHDSKSIWHSNKKTDDYNISVENNKVYISKDLLECINEYPDVYEDGCHQLYQIRAVYFKDGEKIFMDSDFLEMEYDRTEAFVYEMFDKVSCITCIIKGSMSTITGESECYYDVVITRSQIESFPAREDCGIALYLSQNYMESLIEDQL